MRSFVLPVILAVLSVPAWAGDTAKDVNPDEAVALGATVGVGRLVRGTGGGGIG